MRLKLLVVNTNSSRNRIDYASITPNSRLIFGSPQVAVSVALFSVFVAQHHSHRHNLKGQPTTIEATQNLRVTCTCLSFFMLRQKRCCRAALTLFRQTHRKSRRQVFQYHKPTGTVSHSSFIAAQHRYNGITHLLKNGDVQNPDLTYKQAIVGGKELARTGIAGALQTTLAEGTFIQLYRTRIRKGIAGNLAQHPIATARISQYQRGFAH